MESLVDALRAIAEPTRLRIVVALGQCELTVGDLCRVLNQSQPRVSRHLKVLTDAGVLERHAQGTSAFFRPARMTDGREVLDALLPLIPGDDPVIARDRERLGAIRAERAQAAANYFAEIAADWDRMRDLHVADVTVERAMLDAVGDLAVRDLLDVGTGTGRVLEVFADRIERGVGIDNSRSMLDVARSRLDEQRLRHCTVRQGDVYDLPLAAGSFDVAVLHHVLHFLDDPAEAIEQVASTIRAGGRLVIVDFAPHGYESMRVDYAHHWLGFADDEVIDWCRAAGFVDVSVRHMRPRRTAGSEPLVTTMWTATQRADAPSLHPLKAVS
ncbi:MAG: metalloregulator ArsR/SmtB family transcription factor [Actinomycetota bacterium]